MNTEKTHANRDAARAIEGSTSKSDIREKGEKAVAKDKPAAGPHGKPHLTNEDATPGAGSLPEPGSSDATGSTSG